MAVGPTRYPEDVLPAVLAPFALALAAPALHRVARARGLSGWLLALLPLGLFVYFGSLLPTVATGGARASAYPWVPSLGVSLSFYVDGLALLFALLVTAIGALVVVYAGSYLAGDPQLGRFFAYLLLFLGSMLGLVVADNLLLLVVFWELTSVSSFLLIGYTHEDEAARAAAVQALVITGSGGLALLAGLLLLGQVGGSLELSALAAPGRGEAVRADPLYLPILALVLLGAFTKSAQVPFHFWLPNAMAAPTPVSAYLHSATMVKAGVYLLARLHPVLGGTDAWLVSVGGAGLLTMLVGGLLAFGQRDLKRLLAYSTVSALGALVLLLGLGSVAPSAVRAAVVFLLAHALYKGALFMVAGAVDHASGTRDIEQLGGLRRAMPLTALAAALAGLSLAAAGPLLGFVGKELLLEATLQAGTLAPFLAGAATLAGALFAASALLASVRPFWGRLAATPKDAHEAPLSVLLGPMLLALLGLLAGLVPGLVTPLVAPAIAVVEGVGPAVGGGPPADPNLALWLGVTTPLLLSGVSAVGGLMLYTARAPLLRAAHALRPLADHGPSWWYAAGLSGLDALAAWGTRHLQSGSLRRYMLLTLATTTGLVGYTLLTRVDLALALDATSGRLDLHVYELLLVMAILLAAGAALRARSRLAAVAALGVVGYGVALVYVLYGAPDLAMTQLLVETLSVIVYVLVLYHLPRFRPSHRADGLAMAAGRARDAMVAATAGVLMALLVLVATRVAFDPSLSLYLSEQSLPLGHGRNVVNVILVDFRALDTLGEVTVLSLAALGVYALLRLRPTTPDARVAEPLRPRTRLVILPTAARVLLPLLLLFSVFLLARGHNEPGGGFAGGLVAASAFVLYAVAYDVPAARRALGVHPRTLIPIGLLLALGSGLLGLLPGGAFLSGRWASLPLPGGVRADLGSPLLFDLGVYLAVVGVTLTIILTLAVAESRPRPPDAFEPVASEGMPAPAGQEA